MFPTDAKRYKAIRCRNWQSFILISGLSAAILLRSPLLTTAETIVPEAVTEAPNDGVVVHFDKKLYNIPSEYQPSVTPFNAENHYAAFSLSLLLPDFLPADRNPDEFRRLGWHNQLTVLVENGRKFRDPALLLDQSLGWGHVAKRDFSQSADGCRVYKGHFTVAEEIRLCESAFGSFEINCTDDYSSPFCSVMQNVDSSSTIIYRYNKKFVVQEIAIHERMRRLIGGFVNK